MPTACSRRGGLSGRRTAISGALYRGQHASRSRHDRGLSPGQPTGLRGGVPGGAAGARDGAAAARHGVDRRHQDRCQRLKDPLGALRPGAGVAGEAGGGHRGADRQGRGGRCQGRGPTGLAPGDRPARGTEGEARCRLRAAEAEAKARAAAEHPEYDRKKAVFEAKRGRRGRPPKPPDETPPDRQSNLTDPDSALMRKSKAHEYRQAYNAQAVVCAERSQLILATNMAATPSDQPTFAATILSMQSTIGLPKVVLADAGFADGDAVAQLEAAGVEPLVAIAKTQPHRPYDFRPPPAEPKPPRRILEPWRLAMKAKLDTDDGKSRYKKRKQTVEPVFGIIKSAIGSPASTCAASTPSPPSGCSSPSLTTAAGYAACNPPEPPAATNKSETRTRQAARGPAQCRVWSTVRYFCRNGAAGRSWVSVAVVALPRWASIVKPGKWGGAVPTL